MSNPAEDTIQATFKGVPFFVTMETQEGGRKVAVHEYPGSDNRFIEDLGKRPGSFRISGYVAGDSWLQKDKQLTAKLEEDTEGLLELSSFGSFKVKALPFKKTLNQNELGKVFYTMSFYVTKSNPSPDIAFASVETVASLVHNTMKVTDSLFGDGYTAPNTMTVTKSAIYDGETLLQTITDKVTALGGSVDTITAVLNNIRTNINNLVRDPVSYAAELFDDEDGFMGQVFSSVSATTDTLRSLSNLCRIGYNLATDFKSIEDGLLTNDSQSFDIPEFAEDTAYRITSNNNRLLLTNGLRISIYAIYLQIASDSDYGTDTEITDTMSDINDIYENVVLSENIDPLLALEIDRCRTEALQVLETKLQITPKIIDFSLKVPTVDIEIAYRLYAEEFKTVDDLVERAEVLNDLNSLLPTNYKDDIKVLKV